MVGVIPPARRFLVLFAVAAAALAGVSGARAADPSPGDSSGVAQYIEQLPTSSGPAVARRDQGGSDALAPEVRTKLSSQGGADAAVLGDLAAGPSGGSAAPPSDAKPSGAQAGEHETARSAAAPAAAERHGSTAAIWLVVVLAAATLGAAAVLARRRRHRSASS